MPDSQNNLNRPFSLAIDLIRLDIAQPVDEVAIKNVYVDVDDTHIRIAAFDFKSEISADGLIVKLPPTTLGSVYEVRLLSQGSAVLSAYFEMPKDDCFLSDLPLYTAFPPRESYPVDVVNWGDIKGSLENQSDLLEKVFSVSDADNLKVKLDDDFKILNKDISNQKLDTGITATAKFGGVERILADKNAEIISVKDFGAKGDGVTDDSSALVNSILAALETGKALYIPASPTPYMYRKNMLKFLLDTPISESKSLYIFGDGEASCLKMFDGEIDTLYSQSLRFEPSQSMHSFYFKDFAIDNNARGSTPPAPDNLYAYEQSHTISFAGGVGTSIDSITYDNVLVIDPAADAFNNSYRGQGGVIRHINPVERGRTRVRASIQESFGFREITITNPNVASIEAEATIAPTNVSSFMQVTGGSVDILDISANSENDDVKVEANNLNVKKQTNLGLLKELKVSGGQLRLNTANPRFSYLLNSEFSKVKFLHPYDAATGVMPSIEFLRRAGSTTVTDFDDCEFVIDYAGALPVAPTVAMITNRDGTAIASADVGKHIVTVRDCAFDPRAYMSVDAYRMGTVILDNNKYAGTAEAVQWYATTGHATDLTIKGGDYSAVMGLALKVGGVSAGHKLTLVGECFGSKASTWRTLSGSLSTYAAAIYNSRRIVLSDDTIPTNALTNDVVVNSKISNGVGTVVEYQCTVASATNPTYVCHKQLGIYSLPTASLPVLTAKDTLAKAIDTTTNTIKTWTGAAWT